MLTLGFQGRSPWLFIVSSRYRGPNENFRQQFKGLLLVAHFPRDLWFNPIAVPDTTGRISRVVADDLNDHQYSAWTPDGHIVTLQLGLHATLLETYARGALTTRGPLGLRMMFWCWAFRAPVSQAPS
jgi:hypothetical protein